jgi:CelD/BcsL family acetyltransferase involved in cellulose biosynthesis
VERLSLADLDAATSDVEDLVDRTPGADPWCSTPDWVLPAHRAFAPDAEPVVLAGPQTMALLARYRTADGLAVIGGLEPLWGFACPLLGPDPAATARAAARYLAADPGWDLVVLPGLPHDAAVVRAVGGELCRLGPVRAARGITRQVADVAGDLDAFWSRRSARFRRNLRRARRQAEDAGLHIEDAGAGGDLIERLLAIERRSWKGRTGDGLLAPSMARFYRDQADRLARRGRLRASVARLDGRDVGFIVGGRRHRRYRGLQLSFAEEVRHLSVGHLLQADAVQRLAAEGVTTYDLGMDLGYKRRWADRAVSSVTLAVNREAFRSSPSARFEPGEQGAAT